MLLLLGVSFLRARLHLGLRLVYVKWRSAFVAVGLLSLAAPGQSLVCKVAHLQVVVVLAVWGIFNNTNGSIFTS